MDAAFDDLEHDLWAHAREAFDRSIWPVRHVPPTLHVVDVRDSGVGTSRICDESFIEID
jgi:hypothetical protein